MLKDIYKILPVFVIIWIAKRHCESFAIQGWNWRLPFEDVLIRDTQRTPEGVWAGLEPCAECGYLVCDGECTQETNRKETQ